MKPRGRAAAAAAMSDINITPMIDVLLVLLIIFMVVTPIAQQGMEVKIPQPDRQRRPDSPPPPPSLVLVIEPSGLSLNQSPVGSLEDLDARLRSYLETRTDKTLFVRAAGDVIYGQVVDALDVARGAGVDRIGIMPSAAEKP